MDQRTSGWMILSFVFVGFVSAVGLGLIVAVGVEAMNPQLPEMVLGPLLCPTGAQLEIRYVRTLGGGVSETVLNCIDGSGDLVSAPNGALSFLWYGLFVVPMLLLIYPIVVGLRNYNRSHQRHSGSQQTWSTTTTQHHVYTNLSDMPPEAQAALQRLTGAFEDANHDGIPDIFEGGNVQVIDLQSGTGIPTSERDPAQRLKQLKELLDAGLITQQEYEAKRAELLSKL